MFLPQSERPSFAPIQHNRQKADTNQNYIRQTTFGADPLNTNFIGTPSAISDTGHMNTTSQTTCTFYALRKKNA
jgi:hypothetical protein